MDLIWNEFLKIVREEVGSQVVETWFKAVKLKEWNRSLQVVTLQMPNQFVTRWVKDHYLGILKTHLARLLHVVELVIEFESTKVEAQSPVAITPAMVVRPAPAIVPTVQPRPQFVSREGASSLVRVDTYSQDLQNRCRASKINESYTFDTFIVGPSNSLAHAAAIAVSNNAGKEYNPLLIYGGTGLGKTHLLHCIGNEVLRKYPDKKVRYETSDKFITEFITSIKQDKIQVFRQKYEKLDVLLLDDVQFFSNKEQTQEIFFHIFNALHEKKKYIVMSSDTIPQKIDGLQERLKSRFNWGLAVDIQAPALETKIAILQKKSEALGIVADHLALEFIASSVNSNVRELEGALTRINAFAGLMNKTITVDIASQVLLSIGGETKREGVLLHDVLKAVGKYYNMTVLDIKSKKRNKDIATVRQIAFYLMKKLTYSPLQVIGEYVGNRNHSTVIHALAKVEQMIKQDTHLAEKITAIEHEILSRSV